MGIANRILHIILTEVAEISPRMLFPLEIFKDYTISCFKGNTKICSNDLINSFTQKIEKFSQVKLILERFKKKKIKRKLKITFLRNLLKHLI